MTSEGFGEAVCEGLRRELKEARARLREADYLLESIRKGKADALLIEGAGGEEVFTLKSINLLLDFLMDQSLGPTLIVDREGTIVRVSPEVRKLRAGEIKGRPFDEALPLVILGGVVTEGEEDVDDACTPRVFRIREVLAGAVLHGCEAAYVGPDGTRFNLLLAAKPLSPVSSLYQGALISLLDITPRKRAEVQALVRRQQLRYHSDLTENTAEALFLSDAEGRVVFLNPAAESLFGWSLADMSGRDLHRALHPGHASDPAALSRCPLGEALRPGTGTWVREDVFSSASGRDLQVRFSKAPALGEGGSSGFVLSVSDITQRNQTEAALRLSEEKLVQSQKMDAVGRLAGGVAHDFNNLLTAINGYSSLGLAAVEPENPVHGWLGEILKAGERAASLTHQLLAYSRKQILTFKVADLNALAQDTMSIMRRTLGEQISYGLELADGICLAMVDPAQLQQALINLAINARDAMPEGGRLELRIRIVAVNNVDRSGLHGEVTREAVETGLPPGEYVRITMEDSGQGMDADVKSHLFEPFFTTKELGKGTGLGLSMVYGIIKQFQGHIQVFSEPGRGTTIHMFLPRVTLVEQAPKLDPARPEVSHGSETVLLVEDEASVLNLMRQVLSTRGYRVLTAHEGREALSVSAAHPGAIDLLVTDMVMNGMGGQELAHNLRHLRPETRMMFISGYTEDFELRLGLQVEGRDFLQKPFTPEMLSRTVRAALDRQGRHSSI